jgi:SAM-dependent methyltransferase
MTIDPSTARHWDGFYSSAEVHRLKPPSQFGAFVIGEMAPSAMVVDIGCGSGRDALFFASHRYPVVGVDASSAAVSHCQSMSKALDLNATFLCSEVQSPELTTRLRNEPAYQNASDLLVFARFFLHAIPEEAEDALLEFVASVAKPGHTKFAAEFRTQRDATLPKSTAQHYRRFIDPVALLAKAIKQGMSVDYFVEGFGFAKYGGDDAHVARCLFSR